jgi:hypothetical protein
MLHYDNENHVYTWNGERIPSITELAKKFSKMDTSWLEAHPEYAERGTEIHNELAEYFAEDSTMQLEDLQDEKSRAMANRIVRTKNLQSEVIVHNKELGYAGIMDLLYVKDGRCLHLIDFKSGNTPNKKYCACQLNLGRLALQDMGVDVSDCVMSIVTPASSFDVPVMTWDEMVNMSEDDFSPDEDVASKIDALEARLMELLEYVEEYEATDKALRDLMVEQMEASGTNRYHTGYYSYSYSAPQVRRIMDNKKAKELLGDRVEEAMKDSNISASVRVKKLFN